MNYEGRPCKDCGEVIKTYSLSGLCRRCWHKKRGGHKLPNMPVEERIERLIKHHKKDLYNYHYISIGGVSMAEHRYVYERVHGKLPADWIVHHLNGLKGDNRPENLAAMPRGSHDTKQLVSLLQERIRELEAKYGR